MKKTRHTLAIVASIAAAMAALHSGPVCAGPAEDYAEGSQRYNSGDIVAAMPILRRGADGGHAAAQAMLAGILAHADSDPEAAEYFRKSAAQGNADGQFGYGNMLAIGQGTSKNVAEGRRWIEKAAAQGHVMAINEMAHAYISGDLDVPQEARQGPEALRWVKAAADNGYIAAMERMAAAYRAGDFGFGVDVKMAQQWDEKVRKARGIRQTRRNKRSNDQ